MATVPRSDAECLAAYEAIERLGSKAAAGRELGCDATTARRRAKEAVKRGLTGDPVFRDAAKIGGIDDVSNIHAMWKIVKDEDGNGHSIYIKNPNSGGEDLSFTEMVKQAIDDGIGDKAPKYQKRKTKPVGEHLLVVDLADVHFMKLCVKSETGFEYNRKVARHRVIEGTKALLRMAEPMGIGRILFVMGNDILHVDSHNGRTTAGTEQDTEGSIFQGFKDAERAVVDAIELCAEIADVDLVHNMSNHDWRHGWMLSQTVAAHLSNHPHVHATDYGLSESHRKYYRFQDNLFGLTHGDGAKEEKLYGLMVKEARQHVGDCLNLYWLLHHVHHKDRKTRDGNKPFLREKDHNGMTAIISGHDRLEGDALNIEYVRSPSPPDGWHDRNGYVNRQGVECFVFHPYDGQKARFTEWF